MPRSVSPPATVGLAAVLLDREFADARGCWLGELPLQRLENSPPSFSRITTICFFVSIGDVMKHISQDDPPGITFVDVPILPKSDSQNRVKLLICRPQANQLDRLIGIASRRRNW